MLLELGASRTRCLLSAIFFSTVWTRIRKILVEWAILVEGGSLPMDWWLILFNLMTSLVVDRFGTVLTRNFFHTEIWFHFLQEISYLSWKHCSCKNLLGSAVFVAQCSRCCWIVRIFASFCPCILVCSCWYYLVRNRWWWAARPGVRRLATAVRRYVKLDGQFDLAR